MSRKPVYLIPVLSGVCSVALAQNLLSQNSKDDLTLMSIAFFSAALSYFVLTKGKNPDRPLWKLLWPGLARGLLFAGFLGVYLGRSEEEFEIALIIGLGTIIAGLSQDDLDSARKSVAAWFLKGLPKEEKKEDGHD